MIESLLGAESGRYWVTTYSGTRHLVNLDKRTVTRYPAKGHEWNGTPNELYGPDGEPFYYTHAEDIEVGKRMYFVQSGGYLDPDVWRLSSEIVSIEKAEEEE